MSTLGCSLLVLTLCWPSVVMNIISHKGVLAAHPDHIARNRATFQTLHYCADCFLPGQYTALQSTNVLSGGFNRPLKGSFMEMKKSIKVVPMDVAAAAKCFGNQPCHCDSQLRQRLCQVSPSRL